VSNSSLRITLLNRSFERGSITPDMFRVTCVAYEPFNLVSADNAHREMVYPRSDREPSPIEKSFV
jgi:hypothetical protein